MGFTLAQRRAVVLALGALALLNATGLTAAHIFHQPTVLKYAVTVAAPLLLATLVVSRDPVLLVTGGLVIAAPFAGYVVTVGGFTTPLLAPLLACAAYCVVLGQRPTRPRSALGAAGLAFALALLLPLLEGPAPLKVLPTLITLFAAAFLAARCCAGDRGLVTLAWAFLASATLQSLIALWEHATGQRLNLYGGAGLQTYSSTYFFGFVNGAERPPGAFYDPISLGNMLAVAVPLGAGLVVRGVRRQDWVRASLAGVAMVLVLAALETTLDRMSWIGALAGLGVLTAFLPGHPSRRLLLGTLFAAAVALLVLGVGGQSTLSQRAASILHPLSTGNGEDVTRVQIWREAVSQAEAHPVSGVGLGRFASTLGARFAPAGTQGHAHSTYLQLAAEGGIVALVGLLAVLLALRRDLRVLRRVDPMWGAVLTGAVVALLMCWLTDVTIRYSGVAAYMGLLFGMVAGRSRLARSWLQPPERRASTAW